MMLGAVQCTRVTEASLPAQISFVCMSCWTGWISLSREGTACARIDGGRALIIPVHISHRFRQCRNQATCGFLGGIETCHEILRTSSLSSLALTNSLPSIAVTDEIVNHPEDKVRLWHYGSWQEYFPIYARKETKAIAKGFFIFHLRREEGSFRRTQIHNDGGWRRIQGT